MNLRISLDGQFFSDDRLPFAFTAADSPKVGPGTKCSPRHRMTINSRNEGIQYSLMTWRTGAWQMLLAMS